MRKLLPSIPSGLPVSLIKTEASNVSRWKSVIKQQHTKDTHLLAHNAMCTPAGNAQSFCQSIC
jgi:hypothetical protein